MFCHCKGCPHERNCACVCTECHAPIDRRAADFGPPGDERRKRGRPVVLRRKERISFRVPASVLERLCLEAVRRDVSVGKVAREYLLRQLMSASNP